MPSKIDMNQNLIHYCIETYTRDEMIHLNGICRSHTFPIKQFNKPTQFRPQHTLNCSALLHVITCLAMICQYWIWIAELDDEYPDSIHIIKPIHIPKSDGSERHSCLHTLKLVIELFIKLATCSAHSNLRWIHGNEEKKNRKTFNFFNAIPNILFQNSNVVNFNKIFPLEIWELHWSLFKRNYLLKWLNLNSLTFYASIKFYLIKIFYGIFAHHSIVWATHEWSLS